MGMYGIRFCKSGYWQDIIIDENLPCLYDAPVFGQGNKNELWVLLLEKAWAKLHGSYYRIEAGSSEKVMHDLTGAPSFQYTSARPADN
jgi:calpain-15